ncbi:MAG: xanthine dehydrogenase small subunit [Gammaproteobacteria bacterium]
MPASQKSSKPRIDAIRFILDGEVISVRDPDPTKTVLHYLREDLGRIGTKEGCAEGDCGACTVVLAELDASRERLRFRAINACIQFLPTLDGKELITVESLRGPDGGLHPVQRALVDCHGSQCGFCTPGFVMSLFALYKSKSQPSRREINDALAGNLCRCTGYRPIVAAAEKMYEYGDSFDENHQHWMNCSFSSSGEQDISPGVRETVELLRSLQRRATLTIQGKSQYFAPAKLADLAQLAEAHPEARFLAGGTDVGLWATKQQRELPALIYTGAVSELKTIARNDQHIDIGAAASLTDAFSAIVEHYPQLEELCRRFASPPIRNAGTLGGNIANGSPIGDSMPALIVLGATLRLRKGRQIRELALDEFYLAYQKTALEKGEFIERIRIPLPRPGALFRAYKISKRFDQDISALCGAYGVEMDGGKVSRVRIAYGGMAATPKRAPHCEQALAHKDWNEDSVRTAMTALERDFTPLTDMRASKDYRRLVAANLLLKFFLETSAATGGLGVVNYRN